MATGVYVTVQKDLANCLIDDGFAGAGNKRGAENLIADSANLVTVLVGSHEIARFVGHLWASARRRRATSDSSTTAVSNASVTVERDGRRVTITLEQEGFGEAGPPEKVVAGMAACFRRSPNRIRMPPGASTWPSRIAIA